MRILVINGPNLNLIGDREREIYGETGYGELCRSIETYAKGLSVDAEVYQSNGEGDIVTKIQQAKKNFDAIVINAGALTHYSYAVYDALKYAGLPIVEVHISNIFKREEFRKTSVLSPIAVGVVSGLGIDGYFYAIDFLKKTNGKTV
ncbi:MAG: type II 3-dehydroquinate dehydratase [Clostridiales bacterium]|jgi:3-dehydroquinate dehydratase-2|nr:type II 3-dehydroquinate dehydratase [Clostridiales bacterium]